MTRHPTATTLLLALTTLVAFAMAPSACAQERRIPAESIRSSARQVMEQNDYRSLRRRVLEKVPERDLDRGFLKELLQTIGEFLDQTVVTWLGNMMRFLIDLLPDLRSRSGPTAPPPPPAAKSSGTGMNIDLPRVLLTLVLVCMLGIVIWLVAKIVERRRKDPSRGGIPDVGEAALDLSIPPGERAASTYESRAIQLAEQGHFAAAIRELLLGSMSWIERAGLIRFRKGLTNRDYVRAIWRQEERRSAFLVTGSDFERVYFGRRRATAEMFERCLTAFRGAFREETATTPAAV